MKVAQMHVGKTTHGSFAKLVRYMAPLILIASLTTTASSVNASTYVDSVNLGVAADYSIVAGAAITIGSGNVLTGETISGVLGASSGPWRAASLASANAAARTATSSSAATVFPVNRNFTAGVYRYTSYMLATGEITLDAQNDPNAVFIFQIGGYLSTEAGFRVLLANGANPANVFWQVDTYFAPGASTNFKGIVMAGSYVTTGADVILAGKVFALGGAVTIGASNIFTNSLIIQTVSWNPSLTIPSTSSPLVIDAATGNGGGLVTYAISDAGTTNCTIVSSTRTLSYTSAGSCTVIATIASTGTYAGATMSKTFVLSTPSSPTTTPNSPTTTPNSPTTTPTPSNSSSSTNSSTSTNLSTSADSSTSVLTNSKKTLQLVDGSLRVFLRGIGTTGKILSRDRDGALSLRYGGHIQIQQATGFAPNSIVRIYIMSPQKLLRTFRTDAYGKFSGSVVVPPRGNSGRRMLKMTGYKTMGAYRTLWIRARFPSSSATHSSTCHIHITKTIVRAC